MSVTNSQKAKPVLEDLQYKDQLPDLQGSNDGPASVRSLKELQQRKQKFKSFKTKTQDLLQQQLVLQSQLDQSFQSQRMMNPPHNQSQSVLPPMIDQDTSQIMEGVIRHAKVGGASSSLLRRRIPSAQDFHRRKSTPVTPKKNINDITVPAGGHHAGFHLKSFIQGAASNRNQLNLSTVQAPNGNNIKQQRNIDINIFPSLSQTPKFDLIRGQNTMMLQAAAAQNGNEQEQPKHLQIRQSRIVKASQNRGSFLLVTGSKSQSRIRERQGIPGGQAWERMQANQFQLRNSNPQEVLEQLLSLTSQPLLLNYPKPTDLDSTEPLDSFLDTLYNIIESQATSYHPAPLEHNHHYNKLHHLATGMRTDLCEDLLSYLCGLHLRSKFLQDSVEFFSTHISRLTTLESEKEDLKKDLKRLSLEKEELFLQRYDIEKRLQETLRLVDQGKAREADGLKAMKSVTKKLEDKVQECESLQFRLKHIEDMQNMMEPPMSSQSLGAEVNGESDPADIPPMSGGLPDERLKGLEALNKRLENELNLMKKALQEHQESKFNDNVDHFVRIQELFNKVQIENKQLKVNAAKMESKLESKEKLIKHLEGKVTSVLVEKEEQIVKLKSEIVLLKNQIQVDQEKFNQRVQTEQEKYQKQIQSEFKAQVSQLEKEKQDLTKEKDSFLVRISDLQREYDQFTQDFEKYRSDILKQESENQILLTEMQSKLHIANQTQEQTTNELQSRIELLENRLSVQHKQLNIQSLKLKFIKESTQTLVKQKTFILEDLNRYRDQLAQESRRVESTIKSENSSNGENGDYLISVKKAVNQAQNMIDLGLSSLAQLGQIIDFLKVEEMLQMILEQERGTDPNEGSDAAVGVLNVEGSIGAAAEGDLEELNKQIGDEDIRNVDLQQPDDQQIINNTQNFNTLEVKKIYTAKNQTQKPHIEPVNVLKMTKFIPKEGNKTDRANHNLNDFNQVVRDEEHFMVYCPIELSSILIKIIADIFISAELATKQEQLPESLQNLLDIALQKSDLTIEQEILHKYLSDTKQLIEEKLVQLISENDHYKEQIEQYNRVNEPTPRSSKLDNQKSQQDENIKPISSNYASQLSKQSSSVLPEKHSHSGIAGHHSMLQNIDILQVVQDHLALDKQRSKEHRHKSVIHSGIHSPRLLMKQPNQQESLLPPDQQQNHNSSILLSQNATAHQQNQKSARKIKNDELSQLKSEIESLKLSLQEQKQRSKDLQLQLATRIVELEEKLDSVNDQRQMELQELEDIHRQELDKTKLGMSQRESQFIARINEFKERAKELEEQSEELQIEVARLRQHIQEQENERKGFDQKIVQKQEEFQTYKENVNTYMRMKVSQRNVMALALESSNSNLTMINEAMLKYYLNKCIKIDKDKFRFLSTEEQIFEKEQKDMFSLSKIQNETYHITVIKLFIEIIDDQESNQILLQIIDIDKYFRLLKNQIRDGTSILYDLDPLYLSLNLGQIGLDINNNLADYHLLKKKGIQVSFIKQINQLSNEEFMVSVMRHKINPLTFKIIAVSFDQGDEYILDLSESDILEITDGYTHLLERYEPDHLIDHMIQNLTLISKDHGVKVLTCEHKVFFNNLFQDKYQQPQQQTQIINSKNAKFIDNYMISSTMSSNNKNPYKNMNIRDQLIKQQVLSQTQLVKPEYQQNLRLNKEVQVDNDSQIFNTIYIGNQRLGKGLEFKITIQDQIKKQAFQLIIEELKSKKKAQVCFYQQDQEDNYIIYSECLNINESQQILVSAEKVRNDGLFIKLHDLRELASEEFFLIKKSNNTYTKLNRNAGLDLVIKDEFRNLVFDLTFALNIPSSQVLLANIAFHQEQQSFKDDRNESDYLANLLTPPHRKRSGSVNRLIQSRYQQQLFDQAATQRLIDEQGTNILLQKHERGTLLYRNIYIVRCIFEGSDEQEQQSIISFYQKKDLISVEVFLYKDQQKMAIASQVRVEDLFCVTNHNELSFAQKIAMLDQMMDKLHVISENQDYHLKVEDEAIPMTQIMEQRKLALSAESNTLSMKSIDKIQIEQKCSEIQKNREDFLQEGKAQLFSSYALLNNKVYDYNAYFIYKLDTQSVNYSSPKKKQSILKKMLERQATNLEALIEDTLEYDQIYIEVSDKQGEHYATYLNLKILSTLLTQNPDEYKNNFSLVGNRNKDKLVEYLKRHTKIDPNEGITIENYQLSQIQILNNYSKKLGGNYLKRDEHENTKQIENQIITRNLIMNSEVDMSEFTYDLKLYLIRKSTKDQEILSYSLEIFALNEPDFVYRYNHPTAREGGLSSQASLNYEIINLIENPIKNQEALETSQKLDDNQQNRKANLQDLFSKYIDNRMVLITYEQVFPQKLSFCLIEPSSKLLWNYSLIQTQIQDQIKNVVPDNLSNISIIDQGTLEQYIALIYYFQAKSQNDEGFRRLETVQFENCEGNWLDLGDNSSNEESKHNLAKSKKINGNLTVKINKIGIDKIQIKIKIKAKKDSALIRPQSNGSSIEENEQKQQIEIIINAESLNKSLTKLIKRQDEDNSFVLYCEAIDHRIFISLSDLDSQKILYQFNFKNSQYFSQRILTEQFTNTLIEGLKSIFNQIIVDEALQLVEQQYKIQQNNSQTNDIVFQDSLSLTQRRHKTLQISRSQYVILHRKTFFDENQEKLIIVSVQANIDLIYRRLPLSDTQIQESLNPVTEIELLINEPESAIASMDRKDQQQMVFKLGLQSCFHDDEIQGVNLRDISILKKLAKIIAEERAIINRSPDNNSNGETGRSNGLYQIQINLGAGSGNAIHTSIGGDGSVRSSAAVGGPQSTIEGFEETKKLMDDLRKINNVSANGKRRQHTEKNINEIEEEEENEDEDDLTTNDNKRRSGGSHLVQQVLPTSHTLKNQHQLLDQSIIEEEASQEEMDDSPGRQNHDQYQISHHSQFGNDLKDNSHQLNITEDDQAINQYVEEQNRIMQESIQFNQNNVIDSQRDLENDLDENEDDNQSNYSSAQRFNLPRDYILEISLNNSNGVNKYIAKKIYSLDNSIVAQKTLSEQEVNKLIQNENEVKQLKQHEIIDLLAEALQKDIQFK